jgi:hypothetical protein
MTLTSTGVHPGQRPGHGLRILAAGGSAGAVARVRRVPPAPLVAPEPGGERGPA